MGDMLVKSGDWKKGIQVYNLAKQVPQYDTWAFKDVLDVRISSAKENVMNFRKKHRKWRKNRTQKRHACQYFNCLHGLPSNEPKGP